MNICNQYPENDYRYYLEHGTKGKHWTWPDHKYIDIINGRYIYPATQAVKRAVGQVTSGQIVRDTVRTVKGAYNAAKTGGLKGTAEYLKTERKRKKANRTNARNSASSDYAESDRINRKAFNKQEKARKKAAKAEAKRKKKEARKSARQRALKRTFIYRTAERGSVLLKRALRTIKNAPDVLGQRIRARNQRKAAKASLPSEAERNKQLAKARKDIKTRVATANKQKQIARQIYRETGNKVDSKDIDVMNSYYLKNLWNQLTKNRGEYQPKGGS